LYAAEAFDDYWERGEDQVDRGPCDFLKQFGCFSYLLYCSSVGGF
jgi:hypothetical protein